MNRIPHLDITKGMLTFGMVLAHVNNVYGPTISVLNSFSHFMNVVTFSGLLLCFGYGCYKAYLSKDRLPWSRIIKTSMKCYFAFVISSTLYRMVVTQNLTFKGIIKIIFLKDITPYSDFLPAFAIIIVFSCLLKPFLNWATAGLKKMIIVNLILLSFCLLPVKNVTDPWLGIIFGGKDFCYFPVIKYFPLFITGCFFARYNIRYNRILSNLSMLVLILYGILMIRDFSMPRCPPSILWIIASFSLTYIYYLAAILFSKKKEGYIVRYLNYLGHNVLFYLVLSNIFLFLLKNYIPPRSLQTLSLVGLFLIIMVVIWFLQFISVSMGDAKTFLHQKK